MEERAKVIEVTGNKIKLLFNMKEQCDRCGLCKPVDKNSMILEVENSVGAKQGDTVIFSVRPSSLKISAILYGIPSLLLICGVFAGYFYFHSELKGVISGSVIFIISLVFSSFYLRRYKPQIMIAEEEEKEKVC